MDWFIAIGVVVLVAILMIGLFHGPSRRQAGPADVPGEDTTPVEPDVEPPPGPGAGTSSAPGTTSGPARTLDGSMAPEGAAAQPDLAPVAYVLPPPRRRPHLGRRSTGRPGGRRA